MSNDRFNSLEIPSMSDAAAVRAAVLGPVKDDGEPRNNGFHVFSHGGPVKLKSYDELVEAVHQHTEMCVDEIGKPNLHLVGKTPALVWDGQNAWPFTKDGFPRACSQAGMPRAMVDWLIGEKFMDDLPRFFNHAVRNGERMIRLYDSKVRSMPSASYGKFDAQDVLDSLPWEYVEDAYIHRMRVDERGLSASFLVHDRHQPDGGGGNYGIGFDVASNEVNEGSYTVSPFGFTKACTNGVIFGRKEANITFKRHHTGRINSIETRVEVANTIKAALGVAPALVQALEASRNIKIKHSAAKTILALTRVHKLPVHLASDWVRGYNNEVAKGWADPGTAEAIIQGLTLAAHDHPFDRDMETAAGEILLPGIDADLRQIMAKWEMIDHYAATVTDKEEQRILLRVG